MKRILFIANNLEIGGAERAMLSALDMFDKEKYIVDLFLLRHSGPFMKYIPKNVRLLPENEYYADLGVSILEPLKKMHFKIFFGRVIGKYKARLFNKNHGYSGESSTTIHYSFLYTKKYLPQISDEHYDAAFAFTSPYYLANEKIDAKKTFGWIHTDYSVLDGDVEEETRMWDEYDYLVSISKDITEGFSQKYPKLKSKIFEIENASSPDVVLAQSNEFEVKDEMKKENGEILFLSVGRFCHAKNFDNVPEICRILTGKGMRIKWYLIGYGSDEELIRRKIKEANTEEFVIILGKKENPFPYIKYCDFYIQPSRFEGKAVTVSEAQILGKPVIITNYPSSKSQLLDGYDGMIVPMENEKCAEEIYKIVNDQELTKRLSANCQKSNYSNKQEIVKLYELIER